MIKKIKQLDNWTRFFTVLSMLIVLVLAISGISKFLGYELFSALPYLKVANRKFWFLDKPLIRTIVTSIRAIFEMTLIVSTITKVNCFKSDNKIFFAMAIMFAITNFVKPEVYFLACLFSVVGYSFVYSHIGFSVLLKSLFVIFVTCCYQFLTVWVKFDDIDFSINTNTTMNLLFAIDYFIILYTAFKLRTFGRK